MDEIKVIIDTILGVPALGMVLAVFLIVQAVKAGGDQWRPGMWGRGSFGALAIRLLPILLGAILACVPGILATGPALPPEVAAMIREELERSAKVPPDVVAKVHDLCSQGIGIWAKLVVGAAIGGIAGTTFAGIRRARDATNPDAPGGNG